MSAVIPELDNKGLRKFGFVTGAILVAIFAFFFPWLLDMEKMPIWPWVIAGLLWAPALVYPASLRPVYNGWMKVGHAIGWFNTRLILGLLFYVLVLPMGLVMRLFGVDPMARKLDRSVASYRKESVNEPRERLEKPF